MAVEAEEEEEDEERREQTGPRAQTATDAFKNCVKIASCTIRKTFISVEKQLSVNNLHHICNL